jgi:carboxyl-terminal processing protease
MKPYHFASLLAILICFKSESSVFAQSEAHSIATIIKVWGFLNYNSSHVLTSEVNWDSELISALEKYDSTESVELSCRYLISQLPPIHKEKNKMKSRQASSTLSWIDEDKFISNVIKQYLFYLEEVKKPFPNRYLYPKYDGVIGHKNPNHLDFDYRNKYHRLLNLARYWTIIKYFNPYLELLDSWDSTLLEMIPIFNKSQSEADFYQALLQLNSKIEDSHSFINIQPLDFGKDIFGSLYLQDIKLAAVGGAVIVSEIVKGSNTNAQIGDILKEIDGIKLEIFLDSAKELASLSYSDTTRMLTFLARSKEVSRKWTLQRGAESKVIDVYFSEAPVSYPNSFSGCLYQSFGNYFYLMPSNCTQKDFKDLMRKANKYEGLILDMRCYPKDLHFAISTRFSSRFKHFSTNRTADPSYPGSFIERKTRTPLFGRRYKKKVVVLVSHRTVSASEYTVMALQTNPNVKVVGSHTAGANGDVVTIPLHGGYACVFSSIGIYYPNGVVNQQNGVQIDFKVNESINEHLTKDKILEIGRIVMD